MGGGGVNADQLPYVFRNVENRRINHTSVSLNTGSARAWRAPNNQQLSFVTCSALDDMAAIQREISLAPTYEAAAALGKWDREALERAAAEVA